MPPLLFPVVHRPTSTVVSVVVVHLPVPVFLVAHPRPLTSVVRRERPSPDRVPIPMPVLTSVSVRRGPIPTPGLTSVSVPVARVPIPAPVVLARVPIPGPACRPSPSPVLIPVVVPRSEMGIRRSAVHDIVESVSSVHRANSRNNLACVSVVSEQPLPDRP